MAAFRPVDDHSRINVVQRAGLRERFVLQRLSLMRRGQCHAKMRFGRRRSRRVGALGAVDEEKRLRCAFGEPSVAVQLAAVRH